MRQYDIVRLRGGEPAIILQCDLLEHFSTRVVVPLLPATDVEATPRLHPRLRLGRREFIVAMEQIVSVRTVDVTKVVGSAAGIEYEIKRAYDIILGGV